MNKTPRPPSMRPRSTVAPSALPRRVLLLLLLALLLPAAALAQVYRSIGPDGRPTFSDRPPPDAPAEVLPGFAPPASADPTPGGAATPGETELAAGFRGSYDAFEMVTPADNAEVRNADNAVAVSLLLAPPVKPGHRLRVEVDGVPASGDGSMHFELKGLSLGSHRIQALVLDDAGVPAAATPTINVHVRPALPDNALP